MSGEHDTPIGTPVVIAPGKIFLVGEYAVLDEGCAVMAAIARHARAQFIPRIDAMPPMVSELVRRIKAELGEAADALPPGSVLVNTDDFQLGCAAGGLGSSAAIAVAAVGAVYESLGLAVEERRPQILTLADGGRRATQGDVGSGADTTAAAYGGLIQVTRHKDTLPRVDRLIPPAGLHLVLFLAGRSLSTRQMMTGLRDYAQHEAAAYEHAITSLREIAHRFVEEVTAGHATGAVVAAGKYGEELAKLAAAASVPILTENYARASELAHAFGGIAKPAGAGGGEIGIAMFATPEAAKFFRLACTEPLTPIECDIERSGVRCRSPEPTEDEFASEDTTAAGPSAELIEIATAPVREVALVALPSQDMATVPEQRNEIPTVKLDGKPWGHTLRRSIIPAAAIVLAVVATWFTFPKPTDARGHGALPPPLTNESPPLALPEKTAPPAGNAAPPEVTHEPSAKTAVQPTAVQPTHRQPGRPAAARATSPGHKPEPVRHARVAPAHAPATSPDAPARATKSSARRAGNLSPDDF
jgi:phosphomevalonate kinase